MLSGNKNCKRNNKKNMATKLRIKFECILNLFTIQRYRIAGSIILWHGKFNISNKEIDEADFYLFTKRSDYLRSNITVNRLKYKSGITG